MNRSFNNTSTLEHSGVVYEAFGESKTLAEWQQDERCTMSANSLRARLARGIPLEEALTRPVKGRNILYTAFGESKTIAEWVHDPRCHTNGENLRTRIENGMPIEEALTRPTAKHSIQYRAFGVSKTISEWVEDPRCTLKANTLRQRLGRGGQLEDILLRPLARKGARHEAYGEQMTIAAWARDPRCVVSFTSLLQRLNRGWKLEAALTTPSKESPRTVRRGPRPNKRLLPYADEFRVEAFGEKKTLREWSEDERCRVSYTRLRKRLRDGWALEDAIEIAASSVPMYEAFGQKKTLTQWASDPMCVVELKVLRDRISRGEPIMSALVRPFRPKAPEWKVLAFGEVKSLNGWAKDPRCSVSPACLLYRLGLGEPAEDAITRPPSAVVRQNNPTRFRRTARV